MSDLTDKLRGMSDPIAKVAANHIDQLEKRLRIAETYMYLSLDEEQTEALFGGLELLKQSPDQSVREAAETAESVLRI